jgi:hypothetical protein
VPYQLVHEPVDVRATRNTVEILFHHSDRIASHLRRHQKSLHATLTEHMPRSHQAHAE